MPDRENEPRAWSCERCGWVRTYARPPFPTDPPVCSYCGTEDKVVEVPVPDRENEPERVWIIWTNQMTGQIGIRGEWKPLPHTEIEVVPLSALQAERDRAREFENDRDAARNHVERCEFLVEEVEARYEALREAIEDIQAFTTITSENTIFDARAIRQIHSMARAALSPPQEEERCD